MSPKIANISNYTVNDFTSDEKVRYIPTHAEGDPAHEDCENGIVSSCNDKYVFVKYISNDGILQSTSAATNPSDLIKGHY